MEPRPDGRGKYNRWRIVYIQRWLPQWSPGLMAGGSPERGRQCVLDPAAAMEPRPDGRGKFGMIVLYPIERNRRNGAPA